MNSENLVFVIITYSIAFLTAYLINLKYKTTTTHQYSNIDGLKGFLALGVFISHGAIWHQYLKTNIWEPPQSNLFAHLGETSVSFFFMITAFLFTTKLLQQQKINWHQLFISRFFRLTPMYLCSLTIIILLVFILSSWTLKVSMATLLKTIFFWGTFTVIAAPEINAYPTTWLINAGVVWSLPLEILWYFSLPLISFLFIRKKTPWIYLLVSVTFLIFYLSRNGVDNHFFLSFLGGAIAAFIKKYNNGKLRFDTNLVSIINMACVLLLLQFSIFDIWWCKILTVILFNLIALGNSLFGILKASFLRLLGDMCYSTYLLHGIILFLVINFGVGQENMKSLSIISYWLIIFAITPPVVLISFFTYRFIEKPMMALSKKITGAFFKG